MSILKIVTIATLLVGSLVAVPAFAEDAPAACPYTQPIKRSVEYCSAKGLVPGTVYGCVYPRTTQQFTCRRPVYTPPVATACPYGQVRGFSQTTGESVCVIPRPYSAPVVTAPVVTAAVAPVINNYMQPAVTQAVDPMLALATSNWADMEFSPGAAMERTLVTTGGGIVAAGTFAKLLPTPKTIVSQTTGDVINNITTPVTPVTTPGAPVPPGTPPAPGGQPANPGSPIYVPTSVPATIPGGPVQPVVVS